MPIELYQSYKHDLLLVRYPHDATLSDGTKSLREFSDACTDEGPGAILVDCGEADASELCYRSVSGIAAQKAAAFFNLPHCTKFALLARNEMQFGFGRMYQALICERVGFEFTIVTEERAAFEFVDLEFESFDEFIAAVRKENAALLA